MAPLRRWSAPGGALAAAATTLLVDRALRARDVDGATSADRPAGWLRSNYRGRSVSLRGGVSAAAGALVGGALGAGPGWRLAPAIAVGSAVAAGGYDDFLAGRVEHAADKGWRGHLEAARRGRVSGGVVKVAVIGGGALVAVWPTSSASSASSASSNPASSPAWLRRLSAAALVAGTANLVNLFDLRPGRAGKVSLAAAVPLLGGPAGGLAGAVLGSAAAALPGDLAERTMLGDIGANSLGALLGLRLALAPAPVRLGALAAVVGLTAASERVSFSKVIAGTPALRRVDEWGRDVSATAPR